MNTENVSSTIVEKYREGKSRLYKSRPQSRTSEVNLVNDSSGSEECVWSPRTFGIRAQLVNLGSLFKLIRRRLIPSRPCQLP